MFLRRGTGGHRGKDRCASLLCNQEPRPWEAKQEALEPHITAHNKGSQPRPTENPENQRENTVPSGKGEGSTSGFLRAVPKRQMKASVTGALYPTLLPKATKSRNPDSWQRHWPGALISSRRYTGEDTPTTWHPMPWTRWPGLDNEQSGPLTVMIMTTTGNSQGPSPGGQRSLRITDGTSCS